MRKQITKKMMPVLFKYFDYGNYTKNDIVFILKQINTYDLAELAKECEQFTIINCPYFITIYCKDEEMGYDFDNMAYIIINVYKMHKDELENEAYWDCVKNLIKG